MLDELFGWMLLCALEGDQPLFLGIDTLVLLAVVMGWLSSRGCRGDRAALGRPVSAEG